jgi:tetratricopeptide (TPR) repeat protein
MFKVLFRAIAAAGAFAGLMVGAAEAQAPKRVALVIGQDKYASLSELANPRLDARRMAALLAKHGFEVISCDGRAPGCFDLTRADFDRALSQLAAKAAGADMTLVFFAGHGLASDEGNILAPTDAKVDCTTGAVAQGVLVERVMAATEPARHKLLILDACRDNPIGQVCPSLAGRKLPFTRIEAGAMRGLLLVTSTQFGQQALDGLPGAHSPFAAAMFAALEANPGVYFEQVMNEVARTTYDSAQKQAGFLQIPGKVVGGEAPADCLAGKGCVGDARMAALAVENERLAADASGVRNILAEEEKARGKPYTAEARAKRVAELAQTLARIGTSTDPLRQEARRLIDSGNVAGGQTKLDEALDADEKAIAEAERVAAEKRKAAAESARDLAVLVRGTDVVKAVAYYQRATRLDPSDAQTWDNYARAALDAGRTGEAKAAFEQAVLKARDSNNPGQRYWATLGLGDIAMAQGSLPSALRLYQTAAAIAEPIAKADAGNAAWQRDLSVSYDKVGDVLVAQGNLPEALKSFRDSLAIADRLAKADPGNAEWQRDLSVSYEKVGNVLAAQGNLPEALKSFRDSLAIADRLAKVDPGNAGWQRDLSESTSRVGDVLVAQGNLPEALKSFRDSLAIFDRLARADPGNAGWQHDVALSLQRVGLIAARQGQRDSALASYRRGLEIMQRLVKLAPSHAAFKRDLAWFEARIAELERAPAGGKR